LKLLDQVREVLRKKHYSIRTEEAYVEWIKHFILFNGKRFSKDMKEHEISQFISHLATDRNASSRKGGAVFHEGAHGRERRCGMWRWQG
jgi:Phage integrase, N-terminal SAM-like domain